MSGQIIKASEVRAGDTLRVTSIVTALPNGDFGFGQGMNLHVISEHIAIGILGGGTIERLQPPLKFGDRVRHVCGIERPVVTIRATVGGSALVETEDGRFEAAKLADLRLVEPSVYADGHAIREKVDGVFEAGDRVDFKDISPTARRPGTVTMVRDNGFVCVEWDHFPGTGKGPGYSPTSLRHEPTP